MEKQKYYDEIDKMIAESLSLSQFVKKNKIPLESLSSVYSTFNYVAVFNCITIHNIF